MLTSGTIQESTCYAGAGMYSACWKEEETYYDIDGVAVFKRMTSSSLQSYVSAANCPVGPALWLTNVDITLDEAVAAWEEVLNTPADQ